MKKQSFSCQIPKKQGIKIIILISLNLLFLILAFISASVENKYSDLLMILFLSVEIVLLVVTTVFTKKNIIFVSKSDLYDHDANKIYETKDESVLSLFALEKYTDLIINEKEITLRGSHGMTASITVIIPNNRNCRLILDNVKLQGNELPTILIGKNCSIIIELIGDNHLIRNGISVPDSSDLTITGSGHLTVSGEQTSRVGIGGTAEQSYGNITLASSGNIKIVSTGNMSVGIGGGKNPAYSFINLKSGNIQVETTGYQSVGIGCISGNARIEIRDCRLSVNTEATRAVCLGSIMGYVDIMSDAELDIKSDGKYSIAIGVLDQSDGMISIIGGTVNIYFNAHAGAGIGSINGKVNIHILGGDIIIYGEGTDIVGIGDQTGFGNINICNGIISIQLYAATAIPIGNVQRNVVIDGGNIQCDFPEDIIPVNSYKTPLRAHIITQKDEFRKAVETISYSYEYSAKYSSRFPYIKVYLPENIILP